MILPNFFVIGAQKCGTTALYMALKEHPEINMSSVKEPRYFAFANNPPNFQGPGSEHFNSNVIRQITDYSQLFNQTDNFPARGEASPIYLSSYQPGETARQIHNLIPDARLIAIIRQPAERAWSAYLHHRRFGFEPLKSFRKALDQENLRKSMNWYPGWRYLQNGLYAENLKPYFELFDREQIRVYFYEDWNNKPAEVITDIFNFLEVDSNYKSNIQLRHNVSLVPRNRWLQNYLENRKTQGNSHFFNRLSKINQSRPLMPKSIHKELTLKYKESIIALEQLLDQKITNWSL